MPFLQQTTWITLLGLSLIFTGGSVLWVYGARTPQTQTERARWFFIYGAFATTLGIGCLLTAIIRLL